MINYFLIKTLNNHRSVLSVFLHQMHFVFNLLHGFLLAFSHILTSSVFGVTLNYET